MRSRKARAAAIGGMLLVLGAATMIMAGVTSAAGPGPAATKSESLSVGNLDFEADGSFKPTKLPKKRWAPVRRLGVEAHVETTDGRTPPIARRVVVDFDRNGKVFTKGLPRCRTRQLENTLTRQAKRKCRKALIGFGETNAIVDFPDQEPFEAAGPLLAFNGKPKGKKPVIIFHVYACVPAPTTFVVPAVLKKAPGKRFRTRVRAKIPKITGDNGVLTDFEVTLGGKGKVVPRCPEPRKPIKVKTKTKWKHKGKKRTYLRARCPNKRFLARARVDLAPHRASGPPLVERLKVRVTRRCKRR